MRNNVLTAISALALFTGTAAFANADVCDGPFVSPKYPVPHAVHINPSTRCYSKWVVTAQSPEDVRCLFTYVDHVPTTKADVSMTLSQAAYDALLQDAMTKGQTNTGANFGDRYVFIGFRTDLTPTDGTPGCQ